MSPHLVYPNSFRERKAINKFRTSAHNLPVETGRYLGITDRAQRLCPLCNQGVGDESHYLTECNFHLFSTLRTPLYTAILATAPQFANMSNVDKTTFMLSNPDVHTLSQVGKLTHTILEVFRDINQGAKK